LLIVLSGYYNTTLGNDPHSLKNALADEDLQLVPSEIIRLSPKESFFGILPALFLARKPNELADIYFARVRTGPRGTVIGTWWLTNVTRTTSAEEQALVRIGPNVAYSSKLGATYDAVIILDTTGESSKLTEDWPRYAKIQNAITNFQESGRFIGFDRKRYPLNPPARKLKIEAEGKNFIINADDERIVINPRQDLPVTKTDRVQLQKTVKARPGKITWLVDTVRKISWVGPTFVEWLEHTVFGITDSVQRTYHKVFGADTETEVREALAIRERRVDEQMLSTATDPEFGWPPTEIEPILDRKIQEEGKWVPVIDPLFINSYPNAPPAFYQSFIRVDPEREYTHVYVTLWDPRQVQLHIAMGTREPESATGKTGTGMIPRDPLTIKNLVAAFNGGFQAIHGEFGMMADGKVFLPPKPWSATVAVYNDGRVGMGSWPGPRQGNWNEESANSQIPNDMVSLRQNLTSVVEDGKYNPWKRWWWGAAPPWVKEQTFIYRSGLCLTENGFMAFFWGGSMGPEQLGRAMLAARCVRGMHLDMNDKHTGFEFYKPYPTDTPITPLNKELTDAEFEGAIAGAPDFIFRARKGVTTMNPMRFPRYLQRDPRDFFYLTLKHVLPGPSLRIAGKQIDFSTSNLPHAGWPYAFARARITVKGDTSAWLVRIDPNRAVPGPLKNAHHQRALAYLTSTAIVGQEPDDHRLVAVRQRIGWKFEIGSSELNGEVLLRGRLLSDSSVASSAFGIDDDGFLVYAESESNTGRTLLQILQQAGVRKALVLPEQSRFAFIVDDVPISVDGAHVIHTDPPTGMRFFAEDRPSAEIMFADTVPMPYSKWGKLQDTRVRYFPTSEPRFQAPKEIEKKKQGKPR